MGEHNKKRCCTCKKRKAVEDFYRLKSSPDGRYPNCRDCYRTQRITRDERIKAGRRMWQRRLREEALAHYGGRCACCGEKQFEFLALAKIEGAHKERVNARSGSFVYWLKKNQYPPGFRVLCQNCSVALDRYGYCPHGSMV